MHNLIYVIAVLSHLIQQDTVAWKILVDYETEFRAGGGDLVRFRGFLQGLYAAGLLPEPDFNEFESLLTEDPTQPASEPLDRESRRAIEQRITIAAAEALVGAGCCITVVEGDRMLLIDSTDPIAVDASLSEAGEPGFRVKREVDGRVEEGWVDFVGEKGIEVTADAKLKLEDALQPANQLARLIGLWSAVSG
ncbi:TPA: hypothetical protein MXR76_005364 [Pseudomonas aeruginosa]|uniref:hypothetical protein n=1 Tax=Pseudomonas aeruginosa TaxID=287 RepID=UPI00093CC625|nr:hypothetical protein [Pseudomonas aeruginosa]EKF7416645.1 hypothetical protein [Pseudomonas aeruginosa]HCA5867828.1 hypothetical protein [Pseudomonas aeruginosa]HCA7378028.1 hypothetical protein [Pseudomonas aeruginosa]HCA7776276.1 hypothetical protein [Pseudomonas aeruginosa]